MNIEYKSTGTLFDEMFTADLKIEHWPDDKEVATRRHALGNAITVRLLEFFQYVIIDQREIFRLNSEIWKVANELKETLRECWNAQEEIMYYASIPYEDINTESFTDLGKAALQAQGTNARRNRLIRRIDELLQESENTQLRKTYDEQRS